MLTMSAVMMPTAQLAAIPSTAQLPVMQTAKFEQKYLLNHSQMQVASSKPGICAVFWLVNDELDVLSIKTTVPYMHTDNTKILNGIGHTNEFYRYQPIHFIISYQ